MVFRALAAQLKKEQQLDQQAQMLLPGSGEGMQLAHMPLTCRSSLLTKPFSSSTKLRPTSILAL
eukprot:1154237-Pelagomonas_calceolata.AAC.4